MRSPAQSRSVRMMLIATVWLGLPLPFCRAGLLNFQFDANGPSISTNGGTLNYNASTGQFSGSLIPVSLNSTALTAAGYTITFSDAELNFSFFVNSDGSFRSDPDGFNLTGTMTIDPTVSPPSPLPPPTMLTGSLLSGDFFAFGAQDPGPPSWVSDALVQPTDGPLATFLILVDAPPLSPQFPPGGPPIGIQWSVGNVTSGTLGDFSQSFSSTDVTAMIGLTSVPEPSAWLLAAIGLGALLPFRHRARLRRAARCP